MDKKNPRKPRLFQHRSQKQINEYAKYSGLTFQMAALIFLGYWLGGKLDNLVQWRIPVFTIVLIVVFIVLTLYSLIRSLPKD